MNKFNLFHRKTPVKQDLLQKRNVLAKVNQEAAIAERIKNPREVRIEECTFKGKDESIGVQANNLSLIAGASINGNLVVHRTIIFRGRLGEKDE